MHPLHIEGTLFKRLSPRDPISAALLIGSVPCSMHLEEFADINNVVLVLNALTFENLGRHTESSGTGHCPVGMRRLYRSTFELVTALKSLLVSKCSSKLSTMFGLKAENYGDQFNGHFHFALVVGQPR